MYGKTVFFEKKLVVRPIRERIWYISSESEEAVGYYIAYYPSFGKLAVKLDLESMSGGERVKEALVEVFDKAKKQVLSGQIPLGEKISEAIRNPVAG